MQFCAVQGHLIVRNFYILHFTLEHYARTDVPHSQRTLEQIQHLKPFTATYQYFGDEFRSDIANITPSSVVLAFRDYCERTSPFRVFAVCILTPVPAATVMLLIECIPLKDPELGWKANWMMFLRVFVTAIFVGGGIVFLSRAIIEEGRISIPRAIGITIVSAILYTGLGCLLAAAWTFPIPFGIVLMVCPFVSIIMNLIVFSIDRNELKSNQKLQKQLIGHIIGSSTQSLLVVAYPTFNAVFLQLSGLQQAVFMLLLPLIKFITKQIIAKVATPARLHWTVIIFSVDVFNVLYVAICMQTARSLLTTVLVMSSDILHIVLALRSIYHHTNRIQPQNEDNRNYLDTLLVSWTTIHWLNSTLMPYKLPLSEASKDFLLALDQKWNPATTTANIQQEMAHYPYYPIRNDRCRSIGVISSRERLERSIQEGLQVLYHCEYVILSEYIECMLPFVYAGYLAGLYHLPTAAYYPFTRSLTPAKLTSTLIQLVMYGSLEFASFVGLHLTLVHAGKQNWYFDGNSV
ncbi:hypothetical protein GQ600_22333 [Phytophthora cactorum]|nr:hypothetical protein GQ600_22333 [Phytophthora cactorum]